MPISRAQRWMLAAGAVLFLLGLLQGGVVDRFTNPRMALSAHLTAVQSGMAIMIAGLVWRILTIPRPWLALARWSIAGGMYGLWAALTLSAITGASDVLPIAGAGYAASPSAELVTKALILASSAAMTLGWAVLVIGLVRSAPDD